MSWKFNIRKTTALTASLALAGAATVGSTASAGNLPVNPVCEQRAANTCTGNWQYMGYASYTDCLTHQKCVECPHIYGLPCAGADATDPDAATKPW